MIVTANETPHVPAALDEASVQSLVEIINLLGSARDAMSDEMVARLAGTMSEGMALIDRLTRNKGLMCLLQAMERPESQRLMIGLSEALRQTSRDIATSAPARGGLGGLVRVARQPGAQEGIRILAVLGQHLSNSLREQKRGR